MNIDQAARRAAEKAESTFRTNDIDFNIAMVARIIAAEFAPCHERLVEAERLLVQAQEHAAAMANEYGCRKDFRQFKDKLDKFLAAKPEEAK